MFSSFEDLLRKSFLPVLLPLKIFFLFYSLHYINTPVCLQFLYFVSLLLKCIITSVYAFAFTFNNQLSVCHFFISLYLLS
ncbi:hypothetical protein L873DRAFT_365614 [Choiromyces venosus 120613-1]|uniref:Uncharacterized protein n=1 Tax=Choiromyces venosus 120613-1 TaxID=1336337 RepID=A0A3N4JWP3_9PEZI|nr:hypothetical protein L873DRAFT_365614 [Choiromyces venosus 120613-1]